MSHQLHCTFTYLLLYNFTNISYFNSLAKKNTLKKKSSKINKVCKGSSSLTSSSGRSVPRGDAELLVSLSGKASGAGAEGKHTGSPIKGNSEGFRGINCRSWQS